MYPITKEEPIKIKRNLEEAQRIAHLGSWEWNIEESSVSWSDETFRIYGYEPQSFIPSYESYICAVHVEDRVLAEKNLQKALYSNGAFAYEQRIIRPNGEMRIIMNQGEVYFDSDGKPKYIEGTIQDITERKKGEESAKHLSDFKNIILNLSMHFINTPINELKRSLSNAMELVGKYCSADRVSIYRYVWENQIALNLFEWKAGHHVADGEIEIPFHELNPIINCHKRGKVSYGASVKECFTENHPDSAGSILIANSTAVYPLIIDKRFIGFLSITASEPSDLWPVHLEEMLQIFSEMLTAVLRREERENALREAEENVSQILNSTNDAIAMFDYTGHILNINDAYLKRLGMQKQDVIGTEYKHLLPEERYGDMSEKRLQIIREVFHSGKPVITEGFRDGMTFDNRLFPVFKKGKVWAVTLFSTDITDRKKAEEEARLNTELSLEAEILRKKEREYLEIIDGSTEGSYIYDFQSGIPGYSLNWLKRIGGANIPNRDIEKYFRSLVHPDESGKIVEARRKAVETKQTKFMQEYRIKTKNEGYIWILDRSKYQYDENGKPVKVFGAMLDITDRKTMEGELKKIADELTLKNKLMQEKTEELQDAYEQLAANVDVLQETADLRARERLMHELHDKLGHILATASIGVQAVGVLIQKDIDQAKICLGMVAEQIQEASHSLRNMISAGTISLEEHESSFVQSLINLMSETEKHTNIPIKHFISEKVASAFESITIPLRSFIYHALMEGLTNGIRHGAATEFKFNMTETDRYINFHLKDNGRGCSDIKYGYGLSQMQRDAKRFGAKFETNGQNGFSLKISIPFIYQLQMEDRQFE